MEAKKCAEYLGYNPQNSRRLTNQSENASVPLRRENKSTTESRGREGTGGERDSEGERGTRSGVGGDKGERNTESEIQMKVCSSGGWGTGGSH